MQGIIFVIFAAIAIAIVIFGWYASNQRRKELLMWAQSKGLRFDPGRRYNIDDELPAFNCLRQGSSRFAYNFISGILNDKEFIGFDYHYTTGSGKHRQDHYFSAILLQSPVPLKPLFVRSENFFDKITEFAGFDDIDFESAEFSRKFYVKSPDKQWAYDIIHPRTMEFLLRSPIFTIQFDTNQIMAYRNTTFNAADYESAIATIEGMLELMPEYLLKQQKGT